MGLIIHLYGVVTGFASSDIQYIYSMVTFFEKQYVVTGLVSKVREMQQMQGGPYHPPLWRCHWACF